MKLISMALGAAVALLAGSAVAQAPPPDIILLVSDDQRFDTMDAMPITVSEIGGRGVTYTEARVTTPLCCPYRLSLLSGGFQAQDTGILNNHTPNGSRVDWDEHGALNLTLQRAGYRTGIIGVKLANGDRQMQSVAPGWDVWEVQVDPLDRGGHPPSSWTSFFWQVGSSGEVATAPVSTGPIAGHVTVHTGDRAVAFIESTPPGQPMFLYVPFSAPHEPATAHPDDEALYPGFVYDGGSRGDPDNSDLPAAIRAEANRAYNAGRMEVPGKMLRTLPAVDRQVGRILDALADAGRLDNALLIYTSDNGFQWGEHAALDRRGLWGKGYAYEESLRVPLIMAAPGGVQGAVTNGLVAANREIPATIIAAAGVSHPTTGLDQMPRLLGLPCPGCNRDRVIFQHWSDGDDDNRPGWKGWAAVLRTIPASAGTAWTGSRLKYVLHDSDEEELYDLTLDPWEMVNQASAPAYADAKAYLADQLLPNMGLTMRTTVLPDATAGVPYSHAILARGGTPPYRCSAYGLPPGTAMQSATCTVTGTPVSAGVYNLMVEIVDSGVRRYAGGPQAFARPFRLAVN